MQDNNMIHSPLRAIQEEIEQTEKEIHHLEQQVKAKNNVVSKLTRREPSDQYAQMLRDYCNEHFVSKGMCADFAIHDKGDGNPHAHIMLTMRAIGDASKVVPIDKLSVVITLVLAFVFLHEEFTVKSIIGCVLIGAGTLCMVM